jgi:hypothetical protein
MDAPGRRRLLSRSALSRQMPCPIRLVGLSSCEISLSFAIEMRPAIRGSQIKLLRGSRTRQLQTSPRMASGAWFSSLPSRLSVRAVARKRLKIRHSAQSAHSHPVLRLTSTALRFHSAAGATHQLRSSLRTQFACQTRAFQSPSSPSDASAGWIPGNVFCSNNSGDTPR